jgi:outer membrane protein OmpA-like peptidoglycan-associated protein
MIGNFMIGARLYLNKNMPETIKSEAMMSTKDMDYLNYRINENRNLIEQQQVTTQRHQGKIDQLEHDLRETENLVRVAKPNETHERVLPECIYFTLNSSRIPTFEQRKMLETMKFMIAHKNSKLVIKGYADKRTGDAAYNLTLSRRRVEAVASTLVNMGIPKSRLILEWMGDKEQPFSQNDWNRVVVLEEKNKKMLKSEK